MPQEEALEKAKRQKIKIKKIKPRSEYVDILLGTMD